MIDPFAEVALRAAAFLAGAIAFGLPIYRLHAGQSAARDRVALIAAASILLLAALITSASFSAQVFGGWAEGLRASNLQAALTGLPTGQGLVLRMVVSALAVGWATGGLGRPGGAAFMALLGGTGAASFALTGHGASTPGSLGLVHLAADAVHLLFASIWIGALFVLCAALRRRATGVSSDLVDRLDRFGALGAAAVAALLVSGLANAAFILGEDGAATLLSQPYGRLLIAKIAIFVAMTAIACINRFILTSRLRAAAGPADKEIAHTQLKRSISLETALALLAILAVAIMGRLPPG